MQNSKINPLFFLIATKFALSYANAYDCRTQLRGLKIEKLPNPFKDGRVIEFYVSQNVYNPALVYRNYNNEYGIRLMEAVAQDIVELRKTVSSILVMGSGAGFDSIAYAQAFPNAKIVASDISAQAVATTQKSIEHNKLEDRIHVVQSNMFGSFNKEKFDLIVFNAPRDMSKESKTDVPADSSLFDMTGGIGRGFVEGLSEHLSDRGVAFMMSDSRTDYTSSTSLQLSVAAGPYPWRNPWLSRPQMNEQAFHILRFNH